MSSYFNLGIFGGDQRQVYMTSAFLQRGYHVSTYRLTEEVTHDNCTPVNNLHELFQRCNVLIGPIPLTRDLVTVSSNNSSDLTTNNFNNLITKDHILIGGMIPDEIATVCTAKGALYFDLMKNEKIAILNAIATAEGTILEAIKSSDRNLHGSNCLVLGYGRCGRVLAGKLKGLDAKVTIAARSEEALAYAHASGFATVAIKNMNELLPSFHFIFNTIPTLILDQECLKVVAHDVAIIDIASAPGGVDFEYALNKGLNAKLRLGLPGKIAPRTSAEILVTEIDAFMKERSD